MMRPMLRRGDSELNGSWNTICICRRSGRSCRRVKLIDALAVDRSRLLAAGLAGHEPQDRQRQASSCPTPTRRRRRACGPASICRSTPVERHEAVAAREPAASGCRTGAARHDLASTMRPACVVARDPCRRIGHLADHSPRPGVEQALRVFMDLRRIEHRFDAARFDQSPGTHHPDPAPRTNGPAAGHG